MSTGPWWEAARCAGHGHRFDGLNREGTIGTEQKAAQAIYTFCLDCPVRWECGQARDGADGVWGGRWFHDGLERHVSQRTMDKLAGLSHVSRDDDAA